MTTPKNVSIYTAEYDGKRFIGYWLNFNETGVLPRRGGV